MKFIYAEKYKTTLFINTEFGKSFGNVEGTKNYFGNMDCD